jgi:hypothetical protein
MVALGWFHHGNISDDDEDGIMRFSRVFVRVDVLLRGRVLNQKVSSQ